MTTVGSHPSDEMLTSVFVSETVDHQQVALNTQMTDVFLTDKLSNRLSARHISLYPVKKQSLGMRKALGGRPGAEVRAFFQRLFPESVSTSI